MRRDSFARPVLAASMSGASATTLSRMLWTRALPGSVAVLAALSVPGLSLGAGFLAEGQAADAAQGKDAKAAVLRSPPVMGSAPTAAGHAPQSLRSMIAPWAAAAPGVRDNYAAEQSGPIAPLSSALLPAGPRKRVPEISAATVAPVALAVAALPPLAETVSAATGTTAGPVPEAVRMVPAILAANNAGGEVPAAPVAATSDARGLGGTSGALAASVLPASSTPETALSPREAMIGVGAVPAATRTYAPGRREALAPIAAASVPIAAPAPLSASAVPPVRLPVSAPVSAPVSLSVAAKALAPVSAAVPAAAMAVPRVADKRPAPPVAARSVPAAPVPAARAPAAPAPALAPLPRAKLQVPAPGIGRPDALRVDVKSQLLTRIDGKSAGTIDFRQTDAGLQVRLGSIVDLLGDRYDAAQIARIRASSASNVYLSLAQLQAQGIPISYDPIYDEFNVGTFDARPKARLKVHMDQISAPERGLGSTAMEQVRR